MFIIIGLMISGVSIGYLLRKRELIHLPKLISVLIWILLFLLGIEVGNNEAIIKGLHTIGLEAFIITLAGVAGSILTSWTLWVILYKRKKKGAKV
ncbi:MAG: LysO family transporter [Bacteroidaceae bacterium]